jgi:hypothetical protein
VLNKVLRILSFVGIAFVAGLILQCASDPAIMGDDGVVNRFLVDLGVRDGLGVTADAADPQTSSLLRTVHKGELDENGDFRICGGGWTTDDPPMVTVWTRFGGSEFQLHAKRQTDDRIIIDDQGCVYSNFAASFLAALEYRVVIIH